ncbi:uncharacterized protein LOC127059490 [Serinus canaria]|uniref:uncharacterized protein LOC127059490 n=1 Tax=Serinus canaria TaxID=9135 RepID=UPI0021CC9A82|nr:uncharacterized protein LOC127059490 [Serinus canaria]
MCHPGGRRCLHPSPAPLGSPGAADAACLLRAPPARPQTHAGPPPAWAVSRCRLDGGHRRPPAPPGPGGGKRRRRRVRGRIPLSGATPGSLFWSQQGPALPAEDLRYRRIDFGVGITKSLISISAPRSSRLGSCVLCLGLWEVASPSRKSRSASLPSMPADLWSCAGCLQRKRGLSRIVLEDGKLSVSTLRQCAAKDAGTKYCWESNVQGNEAGEEPGAQVQVVVF